MSESVNPVNKYAVNDVYPCIQGEGVQTGVPMILLRLHGCSVGCPFCDTKETWVFDPNCESATLDEALGANARYIHLSGTEINYELKTRWPSFEWVLITGGEPAQYDLKKLVQALHDGGFKVALETSGTEIGHLSAGLDWVCVSPKLYMPGKRRVKPEAMTSADEVKYVIGRQRDLDYLEQLLSLSTLKSTVQICLQPMSQDTKATALCIQTVQARNWRLSLQTHKFIDQP